MPPRGRRVGKKTTHNPNPNGRRGKNATTGDNDDSEDYSDAGEDEEEVVKVGCMFNDTRELFISAATHWSDPLYVANVCFVSIFALIIYICA